jgi:hypothetical protein
MFLAERAEEGEQRAESREWKEENRKSRVVFNANDAHSGDFDQ